MDTIGCSEPSHDWTPTEWSDLMRTLTLTAIALIGLGNSLRADDSAGKSEATPIDISKLTEIAIDPPEITLADPRGMQRILVSGKLGNQLVDVTDLVKLRPLDEKIVTVNERLEAVPLADGQTAIVAEVSELSAQAPVKVANYSVGRPINFPNEVVPVFSKLTCNSGGCHGKSGGQNGFSLSLLGFEPFNDYDYLVKEGRGRRIFPAAPEQSVLLRKATGDLPHGGGKLMKEGDDYHQLIIAWIKQGMPYGSDNDPVVTNIEVIPNQRTLGRHRTQRLRVTATYSDGRTEDVTRFAQFQSNDQAVANVDELGKVTTSDLAGESAIMARYMGRVAVFRATVPVGKEVTIASDFRPANYIDELTAKKWQDLGLIPAEKTSDREFVRRLYIDLCGRLPSPETVDQFVSSQESTKREMLIDQALADPDYASYMALKWGAILQNKRAGRADYAPGTHAMSLWLKNAFYNDLPYDQFVREILTATGTAESNPPVVWFRSVQSREDNVDNVAQLFLGTRIQCARCHHHPFEKWSQDDYYSMAAFFSRIGRKSQGLASNAQPIDAVFVARSGGVKHPRTGADVPARGLDGPVVELPPGVDPRARLADWMTDPANPFFANALVNRIWGHFFSRGIVEPVDDMRVTNPPSNPELLAALAKDFVDSGYSIKHLIKTICMSETYQLRSEPNDYNIHDKQNFARYYPKRLPAEVLLDALDTVTAVPTSFGFPSEMRAVDLPDEQVGSYFLDIFGRPARASSCECERGGEANLSQALHLLNSTEVQGKLTAESSRATTLATDARPDAEKVTELFIRFFARPPRDEEMKTSLDYINGKQDKKVAYQNLIWALINTKEFQFNI